jgi:hypothetical protein
VPVILTLLREFPVSRAFISQTAQRACVRVDVRNYTFHTCTLAAVLATIAGLGPLAGPALAQDTLGATPPAAPAPHRLRVKFDTVNTTHDGHLTLAQAQGGPMPMVVRNFSAIDADHKSYATWADIQHFVQTRRAARRGQTPSGPPS